jgi:hypothetical protein
MKTEKSKKICGDHVGSRPCKKNKWTTTSPHCTGGRCVIMQSSTWRIWGKKQSTTVGAWDHEEEHGVIGSRGRRRLEAAMCLSTAMPGILGEVVVWSPERAQPLVGNVVPPSPSLGHPHGGALIDEGVWNPSGAGILAWWNLSRRVPGGGMVSHRSSVRCRWQRRRCALASTNCGLGAGTERHGIDLAMCKGVVGIWMTCVLFGLGRCGLQVGLIGCRWCGLARTGWHNLGPL